MNYREDREVSKINKQEYLAGLEQLIVIREKNAAEQRKKFISGVVEDPERYRREYKEMLGWPLVGHCADTVPNVSSVKLADEDGYSIYRMQIEVLEGVKLSGLLFKQEGEGKKPLVIVQHGNEGTPELVSGFYGSTSNYNNMVQRVVAQGVHVFAPQLFLWHMQNFDVPYDREAVDARLKRVGSSLTAVEVYGITRIIDYFQQQEYVSNFGMVGMSYGAYYTIHTAAIEKRIKAALACSYFCDRDKYLWGDWTWFRSAERFNDAEVACMICPRKLYLAMGDHDNIFDYKNTLASFEDMKRVYGDKIDSWAKLTIFDGNHEFYRSDEDIISLIQDLT